MSDYSVPMIALSYCNNDTRTNGDWCKSVEEIDEFLDTYPQFFIHMNTHVHEDIYKDHPLID